MGLLSPIRQPGGQGFENVLFWVSYTEPFKMLQKEFSSSQNITVKYLLIDIFLKKRFGICLPLSCFNEVIDQ